MANSDTSKFKTEKPEFVSRSTKQPQRQAPQVSEEIQLVADGEKLDTSFDSRSQSGREMAPETHQGVKLYPLLLFRCSY